MSGPKRIKMEVRGPAATLNLERPVRWTPQGYIAGHLNESFWVMYENGKPFIDTTKPIPEPEQRLEAA